MCSVEDGWVARCSVEDGWVARCAVLRMGGWLGVQC